MREDINTLCIPMPGLKFKGNRDYLQGPDIFNAFLELMVRMNPGIAITDIDIIFHRLAHEGLTLVAALAEGVEPFVQLNCKMDGGRKRFFLINDGRPIIERYDYREEDIVAITKIQIDETAAINAGHLQYSDIERWVAMVKALHHALYPNISGKWLFVRGKFDLYRTLYDDDSLHKVELMANFNNRLTRNVVTVNGSRVGEVFFSLV